MRYVQAASAVVPLKERILNAAAHAPSPTRTQGRRLGAWLAALSLAIGIAIFEIMGGVAHSDARPLVFTVRLADGWALTSIVLSWLVFRATAPRVSSPGLLVAAAIASPIALCAWASFFHGDYANPALPEDWPCFVATVLGGAAPLASFLILRRGIEPAYPGRLGAAAGAACGAWAGLFDLLACPSTDAVHIALGHAAPIVLLAIVGFALGTRVLGLRRLCVPTSWAPGGDVVPIRARQSATLRERGLDGAFHDGARRLDFGLEPADDLATSIHQEFVEVPSDVAAELRVGLGAREVRKERIDTRPLYFHLGEHVELHAVARRAKRLDLLVGPRLLRAELIGRKTEDDKAPRPELLVQLFEPFVLPGEAALRRDVHDEKSLALVIGEPLGFAIDRIGGKFVNATVHGFVSLRFLASPCRF
jgi:hypothetical protein